MRITTKGQVTIPVHIREQAGLLPNTEVDFAYDGKGKVQIFRAKKKSGRKTRGEKLIAQLVEAGRKNRRKMTTDEIMALTRGED